MEKIKRGLQLAGSIIGMCFSSFIMIYSLITLLGYIPWDQIEIVYTTYISLIILAVGNIVVSAFMCPNPNKRSPAKNYTGLIITSLVLNALMICILIYLANMSHIILLVIIGLLVASLAVKEKDVKEVPVVKGKTNEELKVSEIDVRVNEIKELHNAGIISGSEMKEMISKILNKHFEIK